MIVDLPLEKMSITDKLSAMEVLWKDICRTAPDFNSPAWHGDILAEREKKLVNGDDKFIDWEKAKKDIWNSI